MAVRSGLGKAVSAPPAFPAGHGSVNTALGRPTLQSWSNSMEQGSRVSGQSSIIEKPSIVGLTGFQIAVRCLRLNVCWFSLRWLPCLAHEVHRI